MSDFARIEQRQCYAHTLQTVDEAEPFDWTPEVDLVKGLLVPARVQVLLDYFDAARKRASARSQVFVHTVIEDSGLDGEGLAARLLDDAGFAALFEGALEAGMRSAHDQKVLLLARVVAQAANDTASVDDAELVASTIRELQPPHVRALTILADHKMQHPDASGVAAVIEGMAGLRTRGPGKATGSSQILRALMGVADDVADSASATLERQGLIWNDPQASAHGGSQTTGGGSSTCCRIPTSPPDGQTALAGDVTACASGDQQTHRGDQIPGGRAW